METTQKTKHTIKELRELVYLRKELRRLYSENFPGINFSHKHPDYECTYKIEGAAPVQAEGYVIIDGTKYYLYFRSRWENASIQFSRKDYPFNVSQSEIDFQKEIKIQTEVKVDGTDEIIENSGFDASWLPHVEAKKFIDTWIEDFVKHQKKSDSKV